MQIAHHEGAAAEMTYRIGELKLTPEDRQVIAQAKVERQRLRSEASQLSDKNLADKFEVSVITIRRVTEDEA